MSPPAGPVNRFAATPLSGPQRARHVAIIMDGNGRWAKRRGLPRTFGHREGVKALKRIFDDDTLLDMYDHAHDTGDEHCDAIAAELTSRGIVVKPCGKVHLRGFA